MLRSVALAERREESPSVSPEELLPWTVAGIPDNLAASLCGRSFAAPTEIQRLSLPFLRTQERSDVLLAAETGTGKTLAYLLPLMLSLKALELGPSPAGPSRPGRPRALVLAPTRELAAQIAREAKLLAHTLKLRCALAAGTRKKAVELAGLTCPDLVVGTPDRVLWHAEQGRLRLGDVRRAVLDEADTMFDPGFGPSVSKVLFILGRRADADAARHGGAAQSALVPRAREPGSDGRSDGVREACPVTLVAATVSPPIRRLLNSSFPHLRALETRALHRGVAASRHVFEPVPAQGDKLALLLGLAERGAAEQRKTLVFANTLTSCRAVAATLQEAGLDALEFSGRADRAAREQALRAFGLGGAAGEAEVEVGVEEEEWEDGDGDASSGDAPALAQAWTAQRNPILVCSDLAARGLDLAAVDHVINFDFPLNVVDYLHRAGRTARAGRKGTVTSLVGRRDRAFASLVERALRTGAPLDGVVRPGVPAGQRGGEKTARPVAGATVGRSGGERARFGGGRSKFGGERPKFGGERPKFGGGRSKFGGERSKFGGQRAKSGGERSVFDDERARPGGERSKFGGQRARPGGEKSRLGGERSTFGSKRARFGEERGRPGGGRSRLGDNRGRSGDERGRPGENRARAAAWSAQDSASRGWTSVGQQPAADAMDAPKVRARRMRPPSFKK